MNRCILEYIPRGRNKAIAAQSLANIIGISDRRLRAEIADLRAAGTIICSCSRGYYIPATRDEIQEFINIMDAHAKSCFRAVKSARAALKEIEGQQVMTGI